MRRWIVGSLVVVLTCVGGLTAGVAQQSVVVEMRNYAFYPRDTIIPAGSTVRWINFDEAPHAIAMTGGRPGSSPLIEPDKDYAFTFAQPGQFAYRCAVHPTMLGVVVVNAP